MTRLADNTDIKTRRRVRVTAWAVGLVAAVIYIGSILQVVLR